jgi:hypothetical protein
MSGTTSPLLENKVSFFLETTGLAQVFVSDILISIQTMTNFEGQSEYHRNNGVMKLTREVSQFVELTTLLSKAVMQFKKVAMLDFKNSHIHLLFVVKAMNQAHLKGDFIALEELIKYELKDNLTQWKIDLIPQTKRLLNS